MKALLLVRPKHFSFNSETQASNAFQKNISEEHIQNKAVDEFNRFLQVLKLHHIKHVVIDDSNSPVKPDAIFPNNWISTHNGETIVLYPMEAKNRRPERRIDIVQTLQEKYGYKKIIDLTKYENDGQYLEGTGSLVLDRPNRTAFLARSSRSNSNLAEKFCEKLGYDLIDFTAVDGKGIPIYHTNVMISSGERFLVWCPSLISDESDRQRIRNYILDTDKESIEITKDQVAAYAGNILEVKNEEGTNCLLLSTTARRSLTTDQIFALRNHCSLLPIPIPTIEKVGGGSVRCMVAVLD